MISVVIAVLNESLSLPHILPRLASVLPTTEYENIFINEGSKDASPEILRSRIPHRTNSISSLIGLLKSARNAVYRAGDSGGDFDSYFLREDRPALL